MIKSLEELVSAWTKLPTIGRKSAWRLTLHLMERPASEAEQLAKCIVDARKKITHCAICHSYSENELCDICASNARDKSVICVVEKSSDVFTIESALHYRGLYHVLGGLLSPLNGITAEKLQIASLQKRVREGDIKEVIIGLGGSGDAETTSLYLTKILRDANLKTSRFARGLPAGLELEHVDRLTLTQAIDERIDVSR